MDSQSAEATEPRTDSEIVKEEIAVVETTHHEVVEEQPKEDHDGKGVKGPGLTITPGPAFNIGLSPLNLPKLSPQDLATDKILYYFRHPEETPPPTIKNMVKLLQLMKEDEENPKKMKVRISFTHPTSLWKIVLMRKRRRLYMRKVLRHLDEVT